MDRTSGDSTCNNAKSLSSPIKQVWPYLAVMAILGCVLAWADSQRVYAVAQGCVLAILAVLVLALWSWYRTAHKPLPMPLEASAYNRAIRRVLICVAIGYFAVIANAIRYDRWACGLVARAFGYGTLVAGGAFLFGVLLGLLFGFRPTGPFYTSEDRLPRARPQPHTNLEEIADWLTKLILGAGLVELTRSITFLPRVGRFMVGAMEPLPPFPNYYSECRDYQLSLPALAPISLALVGFFLASGILYGYLWSRWEFALAFDTLDCDSTALDLANSWLTQPAPPSEAARLDMVDAIKSASLGARLKIFLQAEQYRRSSTVEANTRTLPIFQALIDADPQELFHRNRAQCAFALMGREKDTQSGTNDWRSALDLLNKAISIRDRIGEQGWRDYELARAICQIHLDSNYINKQQSTGGERVCILADLEKAKVVPTEVIDVIDRDHLIPDWKKLNGGALIPPPSS